MAKFKCLHGPVTVYVQGAGAHEFRPGEVVEVNDKKAIAGLKKSPDVVEVKEPKPRVKD